MSPHRPAVVIVVALLNFVAGVAAVAQGGMGIIYYAALTRQAETSPLMGHLARTIDQEVPRWLGLEIVKALAVVWLGVAFLISGFGLLRWAAFARRWTIFWGLIAVALHLTYLIWEIGWVHPAIAKATAKRPPHEIVERHLRTASSLYQPQKRVEGKEMAVAMGILIAAVLFSAHGALVAILLSSRRVRKAFEHEGQDRLHANKGPQTAKSYQPVLTVIPVETGSPTRSSGREG